MDQGEAKVKLCVRDYQVHASIPKCLQQLIELRDSLHDKTMDEKKRTSKGRKPSGPSLDRPGANKKGETYLYRDP